VDVAIDQGGCSETSKVTTLKQPTYLKYNVIHYCVPNMPALVPKTSTEALTTATFPYILKLASEGVEETIRSNSPLAKGLQVYKGKVVHPVIAKVYKNLA
jgi:alanine dehydrogenase